MTFPLKMLNNFLLATNMAETGFQPPYERMLSLACTIHSKGGWPWWWWFFFRMYGLQPTFWTCSMPSDLRQDVQYQLHTSSWTLGHLPLMKAHFLLLLRRALCLFQGKLCTKNTSIVFRYIYIFHAETNDKCNGHKFYMLSSFRHDHIQFVQK